MSHTDIASQFNKSFEHCVNNPLFLDKFYEVFLASSEEVKLIFQNTGTDMEVQKVMLATSMAYMTRTYNKDSTLLTEIADKHNNKNLNVRPHLYHLWLDSMITSARSIDPQFNGHTEKLWRDVLQPGIDHMINRYNVVI